MNDAEAIKAIKKIKKSFKTSQIVIKRISEYPSQCYIIVDFEVNNKKYIYREDVSESWIEEVNK